MECHPETYGEVVKWLPLKPSSLWPGQTQGLRLVGSNPPGGVFEYYAVQW